MKSAYHQIRLVEGLELEEILCFHVLKGSNWKRSFVFMFEMCS